MEQIIYIVLIFFLLGLFLNHFLPVFEGMCDNEFVWSVEGDERTLDTSEQIEYDRLKTEKETLMKKEECQEQILDKNLGLLTAFEKDNLSDLRDTYNSKLKESKIKLETEYSTFNKLKKALYKQAWPEEGGDSAEQDDVADTQCGKVDGSENTGLDPAVGGDIDTSGQGC
jgi:hypothetical protein